MSLVMQSISQESAKQHRLIRFMSPGSFITAEEAFYLADGDMLRITSGRDGSVNRYICSYLDPYHFTVGFQTYHMDQFSETMGQSGSSYEPEHPITDLSVYQTKYCDRSLYDASGKLIPYHEIIVQYRNHRYDRPILSISVCSKADPSRTVCITQESRDTFDRTFLSYSKLQERISSDLYSMLNHWDRKVLDVLLRDLSLQHEHPSLNHRIAGAEHTAAQQHESMKPPDTQDITR